MATIRHTLPLSVNQDIRTDLHHFFPLSIILARPDFHPWYYQNYVQIYARPFAYTANSGLTSQELFVDFVMPGGFQEILDQSFFSHTYITDIIDFIATNLDGNVHVSVDLDDFYLPVKQQYQYHHFVHPTLIYGYDHEKREFLCMGLAKKNAFKQYTMSYDDFLAAYTSMIELVNSSNRDFGPTFSSTIVTYKPKRTLLDWSHENDYFDLRLQKLFSLDRFITDLRDYLSASECRYNTYLMKGYMTVKYGSDVYDEIVAYLGAGNDDKSYYGSLNAIHLLYEHKKSLYIRLKYIAKIYGMQDTLEILIANYKKIIDSSEKTRFVYMKKHFMGKGDIVDVIQSILAMKEEEIPVLEAVWKQLVRKQTV